ncbi:LLM class flavin-dependent oxidoreductase [Erwiniaceae bacterium BAC15a-03b]|uniref:LLM class flavin-dependent oxidoreductase n=1 Tax=Winslowiella arboricola TaxID=2978220 RepID=A0A9J6PQV0_9GAMM|nr:LLM class flavin-dependent oxidoreductase [Winslowiella arboricola]MCU5773140.1 LLM class flavin-dependent oxidoreductase [Winslowiella arboricola]MCU5778723.1 LLM class flavin-dependent oxidoreductase [Winslowiella arboricola]
MAYRLSLLDKSPVADGESPSQALARTLELAKRAEEWGFHRFWLAEHHNTSALASPAPEVLIAWILAHTQRLRVGSGGVMLQHYSPYKVAENFNLLASLAPGRVDLGVGKAPGGLPLSTRALQQGLHQSEKGDFAAQLEQLDRWLRPDNSAPEQDKLQATPLPSHPAQRFLLGASENSARLAASLGWQFVFAAHINGDIDELARSLETYHRHSDGKRALLAVQVIATDSAAEAERLASDLQHYRVQTADGQSVTVGSLEQANAYIRQSGAEDYRIEPRVSSVIKGSATEVHQQLDALQRRFNIDEFIIDTPISDGKSRIKSLELLAGHQLVTA